MKSEKNINDLFDALRSEKSQISFEEISSQFRSNADTGIRKVNLKKNQLFTLKNLIMILTVLIATSIAIFSWPGKNSEPLLNTNKNSETLIVNNSDENNREKQTAILLPEYPKNKTIAYSPEEENNEVYLQPKMVESDQQSTNKTIQPSEKNILEDEGISDMPILTDEEKEANEKSKREIIKRLEKLDKKYYAFIPSGKVKVNNTNVSINAFYMSRMEITNLEYRTFLFDLVIQNRKDDFLKAKPVQSNWTEMFGETNQSMENQYFTHESYNDYPVVNISREGAEMYCKWLTQEINTYLKAKNKTPLNPIRLPLRSEWMHAAGENPIYPWKGDKTVNSEGCYLANYKPSEDNYHDDGGFFTVKVNSYLPNEFGIYNLSGNVAEMVYESSKKTEFGTAGGGWLSSEDELKINGVDMYKNYSDAHPNIGFRIVFSHI